MNCQSVFRTKRALARHLNGPWCRDKHEMSELRLRRLPGFVRFPTNELNSSMLLLNLSISCERSFCRSSERIVVNCNGDINGNRFEAVGSGRRSGGATREELRRICLSTSVMSKLNKVEFHCSFYTS